jgi:hypothetical protein
MNTMASTTGNNDGNSDLFQMNRSIIAAATKDSLDRDQPEHSEENETMSIASTIDIDNTSCYLKRFADKYVNSKSKDVKPMFVKINKFKMNQEVIYTGHGSHDFARIVDVYYEETNRPMYNIELSDGYVEAHVGEDLLERVGRIKSDIKGGVPLIPTLDDPLTMATPTVVEFESSPTLLFSYIYSGDFDDAKHQVITHPDEARVCVIRYVGKGTHSNGANSQKKVRWKLLPLHLFITLAGSHDYRSDGGAVNESKAPPLELLSELLSTYPHAVKCIDDQGLIPLHSSIRGQSSPCVIKALTDISPESVFWRDIKGRDAFVLLEQVFKSQMRHAVISAESEDECNDALKIREWKREVLSILTNASKQGQLNLQKKLTDMEKDHSNVGLAKKKEATEMELRGTCEERDDTDVRYLQVHFPAPNESFISKDITPCSTMTAVTEVTTPTSTDQEKGIASMNWESRCRMMELESFDSQDKNPFVFCSGGEGRAEVSTTPVTDSSSIFRSRGAHHEEAVKKGHIVCDSSDECANKGGDTLMDSSLILTAIFSYQDEGEDSASVGPSIFSKDALEIPGTHDNEPIVAHSSPVAESSGDNDTSYEMVEQATRDHPKQNECDDKQFCLGENIL